MGQERLTGLLVWLRAQHCLKLSFHNEITFLAFLGKLETHVPT